MFWPLLCVKLLMVACVNVAHEMLCCMSWGSLMDGGCISCTFLRCLQLQSPDVPRILFTCVLKHSSALQPANLPPLNNDSPRAQTHRYKSTHYAVCHLCVSLLYCYCRYCSEPETVTQSVTLNACCGCNGQYF